MEVASPLTFGHVSAGSKRRFTCSPILDTPHGSVGLDAASTDDYAMDESSAYGQNFKRRRFGSGESSEISQANTATFSAFRTAGIGSSAHGQGGGGLKRQRNDEIVHASDSPAMSHSVPSAHTIHLQRVIEKQSADIQSLRNEKASMESNINELTSTHERTLHENRILKKAVTVQQQRQNHALSELEAARQYKDGAEEKMRKLEHVINSLRYHLQAQQFPGNDFMGINTPRPPDVF
jgi:hypothetical protein